MKIKKIFSVVISTAICLSILPATINVESYNDVFEGNFDITNNTTYAWDELTEDIDFEESDTNDLDVEYANIFQMGNFYSFGNDKISTYTTLNNWVVAPSKTLRSTNSFSLNEGDAIKFDITISPAMDTSTLKIGIYNVDTQKTTYISRNSNGSMVGNYTVKQSGNYKIEAKNLSSNTTVTLTGSYYIMAFNYSVPVDYIPQGENWCWAASIEMCAKALGYTTRTQEDIVKAVKGSIIYEGGQPEEFTSGVKYATGGVRQSDGTIKGGAYTTSVYRSALTTTEIKTELSANRPIIADFEHLTQTGRHAVVLNGFDSANNYVRFIDPNPASDKPKYYKYSEALSNTTSIWNRTYRLTANTEK